MAEQRTGSGLQVTLALIAAVATIAAALIGNWQSIFDGDDPQATTVASAMTTEVTNTLQRGSGTSATGGGPTDDDCLITVANPLAVIREEPDVFAQQAASAAAGVYPVLEVRDVSFGSQQQRWFRISVDGRSGWIRDSSFDVASKTTACP